MDWITYSLSLNLLLYKPWDDHFSLIYKTLNRKRLFGFNNHWYLSNQPSHRKLKVSFKNFGEFSIRIHCYFFDKKCFSYFEWIWEIKYIKKTINVENTFYSSLYTDKNLTEFQFNSSRCFFILLDWIVEKIKGSGFWS